MTAALKLLYEYQKMGLMHGWLETYAHQPYF
jgi:hypothetical protein